MAKKIMAMFLVLLMTLSIAACGSSDDGGSKTDNSSNSNTTSDGSTSSNGDTSSTDTSGIDTSKHVKITYMITGNKPTNGRTEEMLEKLNAILTEKVNAELDIYWIEWTDYLTNYNLTLASNDGTIDLVGTATDWLDAWPNAQRGAFYDLSEEMLKTYAPLTWEQVSDDHWNMCKLDGKIYLMPEDNYAQWINHGFIYRGDWAQEFGMNSIDTWEDMGKYFAKVKETKEGVIPWDVAGSTGIATTISGGYIASHGDYVMVDGMDVPIFYGTKDDLYALESPVMEDDSFVEFAKLMKEWSDAGYWREDCLNYSGDSKEEFFDGLTSVHQHHTESWYGTDFIQMEDRQPGSDIGFFYFGKESKNLTKISVTHGATAVAAGSENPDRALMVYDLLRNDEELHRLFCHGIEGIQYEVDENGYMVRPENYDGDTDGIQTNFWWGRNDDLLLKDAARNHEDYNTLVKEYEAFAIDYPYGQFVPDTSQIGSYLANMSNVYSTYMPVIAFGKVDDPEASVQEFRDAMKAAGYDEVMAELQKQMDDFKASNN